MASVKDAALINIAVDLSETAPLFRVQRRSVGETGSLALDLPKSFSINAASIRNASPNFDGFTRTSGSYTLTSIDTVGPNVRLSGGSRTVRRSRPSTPSPRLAYH